MRQYIDYRLVRTAPTIGKHKGEILYRANIRRAGVIDLDTLTDLLADGTTVGRADVLAVLCRLSEKVIDLLVMGHTVSLGDLGTLRLSLSSKAVSDPKDFDVSMFRKPRFVFKPHKRIAQALRDPHYHRHS